MLYYEVWSNLMILNCLTLVFNGLVSWLHSWKNLDINMYLALNGVTIISLMALMLAGKVY